MIPQKRPAVNVTLLIRSVLFRTKLIDTTVGMFIGLVGVAMLMYRGGTWWEPQRRGHSFWENFLCDLLHHQTLGGEPNVVGSRLSLSGMLVLIVGLVVAFSLAPEVIPSRRSLGQLVARLGAFSSLCLVCSPLFPSDNYPLLHSVSVVMGGLPALISLAVFVGAILVEPVTSRLLRAVSLGLLVSVVVAMALYAWTAFLHGPSLRILPGIERVANLALLLWLLLLARLVRFRLFTAYIALTHRRSASVVQN